MSVTLPIPSDRIAAWMMRFRDGIDASHIVSVAGEAVYEAILDKLDSDLSNRHSTADRLGAAPTNHWDNPESYVRLVSSHASADVTLSRPGITRAIKDVTIRPRQASALTIPVAALSYGRRVSEVERLLGKPLFRPKGTNILAASRDDGALEPLYILASSVFQKRDPSMLPSEDEIQKAVTAAAINAIEAQAYAAAKGV